MFGHCDPEANDMRRLSNILRMGIFLAGGGLLFLGVIEANAANYYISPTGNDTSGNGTTGNPWKTLDKAMSVGSGGDTYIFKDGAYNYAGIELDASIKNGSAGAYTTIRAENDGGAVITQMDGFNLDGGAYVKIEGFKFNYAGSKLIYKSNHIKVLRCAMQGGPSSGNTVQGDATESSYILFEDCWFYGPGGRYNLLIYYSDHVIARRCVFRHDGGWSDTKGDPEAVTNAYTSSYVYYQNCIILDSTSAYYTNPYGGFYQTTDTAVSNISWEGCIAINGTNSAFGIDPKSGNSSTILTIKDCVAYGYQDGIYAQPGAALTILRATVGALTGPGDAAISRYGGSVSASYCDVFNNANGNFNGVTPTYSNSYPTSQSGTGNVNVDPRTNGLLYLPRTENGSFLATHQAGGRMGAQIVNRIGVSGTLYGDTGWNVDTGESLWPFPNETRIKADMSSVSTRGFCAAGMSLTKYIWEYLGNAMPVFGGKKPSAPIIIGVQ